MKSSAAACPHCGSDERTGWSDSTYMDGIDTGEDFDYNEAAAREFGTGHVRTAWWRSWKFIAAAALLLLFALGYLRMIM